MKKVWISQPMIGLTDEQILKTREKIKCVVEGVIGEKVELLESFFKDFEPSGNVLVAYLGKSISLLAEADIVYFGGDWEETRECKIEYKVASEYGIKIIEG